MSIYISSWFHLSGEPKTDLLLGKLTIVISYYILFNTIEGICEFVFLKKGCDNFHILRLLNDER